MSDFAALTDLFEDGVVDTGLWFNGGGATEAGGFLQLNIGTNGSTIGNTAYNVGSVAAYSGWAVVVVDPAASTATPFVKLYCQGSSNAFAVERVSLTQVRMMAVNGGAASSITVFETADAYWRLSANAGGGSFESSADGVTWTSRGSVSVSLGVSDFKLILGAQGGNGTSARFAGVNPQPTVITGLPPATATISAKVPATQRMVAATKLAAGVTAPAPEILVPPAGGGGASYDAEVEADSPAVRVPVDSGATPPFEGAGAKTFSAAGNGVGTREDIPGMPTMQGDWSVEFWAKPGGNGNPAAVTIGSSLGTWPTNTVIFYTGEPVGEACTRVYWGGTLVGYANAADNGTWHHLVFTKTTSTLTLYVDGVQRATSTPGPATGPLGYGRLGEAGGQFYAGDLSQVAIYETALSGARVLAHFEASTAVASTTVMVIAIKASSSAPTPTVLAPEPPTSVAAVVATVSVVMVAPTKLLKVTAPSLAGLIAMLVPALDVPTPTALSPPPMQASAACPAPSAESLPNSTSTAPPCQAGVLMLPPGEYIRISAPAILATATALPAARAGAALSDYAASVMQNERCWGGALAYYRLSDQGPTMTDVSGNYHGGWVGTRSVEAGAIALDGDGSTFFNGADTGGRAGMLPQLNVVGDDPRTLRGNADPFHLASLYYEGASVELWVKTNPGALSTSEYLLSWMENAFPTTTIRFAGNGRVIARTQAVSEWTDLGSTRLVNDGEWHQVVLTIGRDLIDESVNGASWMRLYVDGVLDNQTSAQTFVGPWRSDLFLGSLGDAPETFFEGHLDDVSVYDMALTRWQVLEHFNQGKALSGPPLRIEPAPITSSSRAPAPTYRHSVIRPLQDLTDDFEYLDTNKWRDQKGAAVTAGHLVLNANGDKVLTPDYFQCRDGSFIVRVDKLPLGAGDVFVGLVNEHDIIPADLNHFDSFRRHRDIGFVISRQQYYGSTATFLFARCSGITEGAGSKTRQGVVKYMIDDPNYPSEMKWLKLDIDPGDHGGAWWSYGPDGVIWTDFYDAHGGAANAVLSTNPVTGVIETDYVYESNDDFFLFDHDEMFPVETRWRGHMRVLIQATGNANPQAFTTVDNFNVAPDGTGENVEVSAEPDVIWTSTTTEYLLYALDPELYSSALPRSLEVVPMKASWTFPVPPEPVRVNATVSLASWASPDPQRAGDAVPIAVSAEVATASWRLPEPDSAGDALPVAVEAVVAAVGVLAWPPEVNVDESLPAPVPGPKPRNMTILTRTVTISVTQN